MPPCASGWNIGTRDGRGTDIANATVSMRIMRRRLSSGEYLVLRHEVIVLEGNAIASCSKRWMIDRSISRFMIIPGLFVYNRPFPWSLLFCINSDLTAGSTTSCVWAFLRRINILFLESFVQYSFIIVNERNTAFLPLILLSKDWPVCITCYELLKSSVKILV